MQIRNKVYTVVGLLKVHPSFYGSKVISQMNRSRWLYTGYNLFRINNIRLNGQRHESDTMLIWPSNRILAITATITVKNTFVEKPAFCRYAIRCIHWNGIDFAFMAVIVQISKHPNAITITCDETPFKTVSVFCWVMALNGNVNG